MTRLIVMCISFILICLIFAGQNHAQMSSDTILGIWLLDEGAGDLTEDASGNGHNGTLVNGPEWIAGQFGNALSFVPNSYVDCGNDPALNIDVFSISFWCNIANTQGWIHIVSRGQHFGSGNPGGNNWGIMMCDGRETIRFEVFNNTSWTRVDTDTTLGEWHHIVATFDVADGTQQLYHDGELAGTIKGGIMLQEDKPLFIGAQSRDTGAGTSFDGSIDEVGYFNVVLTPKQIEEIMTAGLLGNSVGVPKALNPQPADGDLYEDTWASLSWKPGDFAVSHDVYFGEDFDVVSEATRDSDVYRGNQVGTFYTAGFPGFAYPEGLVPGAAYYWRIDEVNDADPDSPWKGDVWSFSIPPETAYYPNPTDSAEIATTIVTLSWTPGFGAKLHTVYFGDDYDQVNNATVGVPIGGTAFYNPGQLEKGKAYYWRVDEYNGTDTFKGDVWTFTTPGAVGDPQPANGATDVAMTTILSWTAADKAASHEVYFGLDKDTVRSADTSSSEYKGSKGLGDESYDPGPLEWNTTYYWRVDEANNTNTDSPWTGPLWSFTTANFLTIDNMESYNDLDPAEEGSNRIFNAWIDGYDDPTNGSLVGYDQPPFAEQTVIHSGNQSMPMYYDNSAATKSEATSILTSNRDWTVNGVNTLTIWFKGETGNTAEQMYVALNGSARIDHDDPDAATSTRWTQWNIDLQAFTDQGVNLSNVNSITLGLSSVTAGTGKLYFDDIRLYPPEP